MSEIVTTYLLSDLDQPMPMGRQEFYEEQIRIFKTTGKPTRAIEIVQILLFTPDKDIILQKRSKHKNHNPSKIDKTVGGHMLFGDTPTYTVMAETLQEMQVASFVLNSEDDFSRTYKLLRKYIGSSAIIQYIDSHTYTSEKIINKETVKIANKYHFYLGVYNGTIRPADKEASGILFYDYATLQEEIAETPGIFTADLKFFLDKYKPKIENFLNKID